jgi:hypothetical protein
LKARALEAPPITMSSERLRHQARRERMKTPEGLATRCGEPPHPCANWLNQSRAQLQVPGLFAES